MKPKVFSQMWQRLPRVEHEPRRVWLVAFTDTCGCDYEEDFPSHATALRFARHLALGGSRWEFTA